MLVNFSSSTVQLYENPYLAFPVAAMALLSAYKSTLRIQRNETMDGINIGIADSYPLGHSVQPKPHHHQENLWHQQQERNVMYATGSPMTGPNKMFVPKQEK